MAIVIGGNVILEMFAGTDPVTEVFVGTDKVFPGPFPVVTITMTPSQVIIGGVLTFEASVTADTSVVFAWFEDGMVIGGETAPVYERTTIEADNNVNITCSATDLYGQTTVSESQTMNVGSALSASTPDNQTVANGATATFTTVASDGFPPYTYQWQRDTVDIVGATNTSYTTPVTDYNTSNGEVFRCVVTDSDLIPTEVTTGNATLTITLPAFSVSHTMNPATVFTGGILAFVATASGEYGATTYQWQLNQVDIGGETGTTYNRTTIGSDNGKNIRCLATRTADSNAVFSVNTPMIVYGAVTGSVTPTSYSGVEGTVAAFSCAAGGGNGIYTYQWQLNNANIGGATLSTYNRTTVLADNGKNIRCVVSSAGGVGNSNAAVMTISANIIGQALFDVVESTSWLCPAGVTSVSVCAIGGGRGGSDVNLRDGGGGGGLGWKNNIAVIPGNSYTVVVGKGGVTTSVVQSTTAPAFGDDSYFVDVNTARGLGATTRVGGSFVGDGGGVGGDGGHGTSSGNVSASGGGGAAGGYTAKGAGGGFGGSGGTNGANGITGSGGGGGGCNINNAENRWGGVGGGTGIKGQGANGVGGSNLGTFGTAGTDGSAGSYGWGGYGGYTGGGTGSSNGNSGAVRIIWGLGRTYPSNAADA